MNNKSPSNNNKNKCFFFFHLIAYKDNVSSPFLTSKDFAGRLERASCTLKQELNKLKSNKEFDLLIVGGGATGIGVALDAAFRELNVALVERDDFASDMYISSRSTKLVHDGVRYLQKAIMELDYEQYKLVVEALHERRIFIDNAPYLAGFIKNEEGHIKGAKVKDCLTGDEWEMKAKGVINATGPFTDGLRKVDDEKTREIVASSAGVHVIISSYYCPRSMSLLDPDTSDGRVIFFLPLQGNSIAGTTNSPTEVSANPVLKENEVQWILQEVAHYLSGDIKVRSEVVLSAWSGIRPLIRDPHAKNTEFLVRNHMINVSKNKLLTIAGGSFKTVVWIPVLLKFCYGTRAWPVAAIEDSTEMNWPKYGKRISPSYPYIEAKVHYAVREEYALQLMS
ncbi:unnamed protein product [Mucor circinelloides]